MSYPHDWHPTHSPASPADEGFLRDAVRCAGCGTLLRTRQGPSVNAKVTAPCAPVPARTP